MWVRRSAWERVTEREELVGRLRVGSRFPQYLHEEFVSRGALKWVGGTSGMWGGVGEGGCGCGRKWRKGGRKKREELRRKGNLLDNSNVHGSRGARAINLCLGHLNFFFSNFQKEKTVK